MTSPGRDREVNLALWTTVNADFTDARAASAWAATEITWGLFEVPEAELRVLGDVAGLDVIEAVNGQDGYDKATTNTVHAVITDLNMPVLNGIEFIRKYRQHPSSKGIPIILLTTESDEDLKRQAKEAGATGWITGVGVLAPLAKRVTALVEEKGATHPETTAQIKKILMIARIDVALLLLVVLDMVTKPAF